ncbi:unnamed protein product [Citrullus colocynthis]|uniref:Uncharacterized protein n=1 Tax=Citrullus colocynthis TaxID=252529 RepID=A0ABP0YIE7_9ROSI
MGACATKPKVLKAEAGEAPAPAPEPSPEEVAAGTKPENDGDEKASEIVHDEKVDSKSRSLSNLFTDQKEGSKESKENEKAAAEDPSEKQETTAPETEKQVINPPPEEKRPESNPPESEPPVSDSVTENKTIISSEKLMETPNEPNKHNDPKIEDKIKVEITNENDPPLEKTESSEKPTETEKEVKVISN